MPVPAYMTITGKTQNNITEKALSPESLGHFAQDSHSDEILVQAFEHTVRRPSSRQAPGAAGDVVHEELCVTKFYDKTSPQLYKALTEGEELTVEIKWYRPRSQGAGMEHYFSHTLQSATITSIKAIMPDCQDPAQEAFGHTEEVRFRYRDIVWEHKLASTQHTDQWSNRN